MSWDSYIDNLLAQSRDSSGASHCDSGAIIGIDGGAAWTTATGAGGPQLLKINPQEGAVIAQAFKTKKFDTFMANGVVIGGVKYNFLREEDQKVVYGKKKEFGSITLQGSKTAIVIGHCPEGCQQGNLNKGVNVIAEYLEGLGM